MNNTSIESSREVGQGAVSAIGRARCSMSAGAYDGHRRRKSAGLVIIMVMAAALSAAAPIGAGEIDRDESGTCAGARQGEAPQVLLNKGLAKSRSFDTERVGFEPTVP